MERFLCLECLNWNLNITTPYHLSDSMQGMGCLFWSDFSQEVSQGFLKDKCNTVQDPEVCNVNTQSHNKMVLMQI